MCPAVLPGRTQIPWFYGCIKMRSEKGRRVSKMGMHNGVLGCAKALSSSPIAYHEHFKRCVPTCRVMSNKAGGKIDLDRNRTIANEMIQILL